MGIKIGDNNEVNNTIISDNSDIDCEKKKNFIEKHPIIISFIISLITGFFLLFSFWGKIVEWIEGLLFGG